MSSNHFELVEFIRNRILKEGPVSFRWFMEQALYHPDYGYYASGRASPGKSGDFFTNVSVSNLFGKLMSSQFREMWSFVGEPDRFVIVEQGANNGDFAKDVLSSLQLTARDFYDALTYIIVEPFDILQRRQKETLKTVVDKVIWHRSLAELDPFCGVHFSNELFDSMPIHLITWAENSWQEKYIDFKNNEFTWVKGPISIKALQAYVEKIPPIAVENYQTEVNLDMLSWMEELSKKIHCGYVLTVDYGYSREVFYNPSRITGTLTCYSQHRRSFDPLQNIGNADITSHLEFTTLVEQAEQLGFKLAGFTDQHHFMVGLGKHEFPDSEVATPKQKNDLRAFSTLMHPNLMGLSFKFLGLSKNIPTSEPLSGFQFASDPRKALGL